ncbi:MAG TPA: DnaB-like helicase N-terminal domain-containing protein [Pyrinomonadaceae bacterium]|jgi:replicative DNA helicase|nr:DnaB-like helicase N-terminal domain-containing protein [Pyrinomonadaceae bacterium]
MADPKEDLYSQNDEKQFTRETLHGERAIIGAVIRDNDLMKYAAEHLSPASFNISEHHHIFAAMSELYKRQVAISKQNIVSELRSRDNLDASGGEEYVASLDEDVPFRLTAEQDDYVDRFILVAIGKATSATALNGDFSAKDVINMYFEKTQKLRELRGWKASPLLDRADALVEDTNALLEEDEGFTN